MQEKLKVVHSDAPVFMDFSLERDLIEKLCGAELQLNRDTSIPGLKKALRYADGILVKEANINSEIIEGLERAKVLVRCGIGVDAIDIEAATRRNICVVNVPDYCIEEVSNHAMELLLAANSSLIRLNSSMRAGDTVSRPPELIGPLEGEILGIIGFGNIGKSVARKASAFGLRILAYDPYISDEVFEEKNVERRNDLHELLRESDYVSLHVPLTQETTHLFRTDEFGVMKANAIIVNTSRGSVIDEKALIEALQSRKIRAAGLDVFEQEPLPKESPLLKREDVVLTPHIAYFSDRSIMVLRQRVVEEVSRVLRGEWPINLVNSSLKQCLNLKNADLK